MLTALCSTHRHLIAIHVHYIRVNKPDLLILRPTQHTTHDYIHTYSLLLPQIRSELAIVQNDAKLLTEMLTALGDSDDVGGNEIILELAGTLIEMQERMMALLDVLLNEDVSGQSWGWSRVEWSGV